MLGIVRLYVIYGPALSIGATVVFLHPSIAGIHSYLSLEALLFYLIANATEAIYAVVLLALMMKKGRSAIANNMIFNVLTVLYPVSWNAVGEKSNFGTFVDSLPGLIGLSYFLRSRRVRAPLIVTRNRPGRYESAV